MHDFVPRYLELVSHRAGPPESDSGALFGLMMRVLNGLSATRQQPSSSFRLAGHPPETCYRQFVSRPLTANASGDRGDDGDDNNSDGDNSDGDNSDGDGGVLLSPPAPATQLVLLKVLRCRRRG